MFSASRIRLFALIASLAAAGCKGGIVSDPDDLTGYSVSLTPNSVAIPPGGSISTAVNIVRTSFVDPVEISVTGLPEGVTGTFDPASHITTATTLTLNADPTVENGIYKLSVNATSTAGVSSSILTLTVSTVIATGRIAQVDAGAGHSCAVKVSGQAFCWGANAFGQLGDATTTSRLFPTRLSGVVNFSSIAAGESHSCGISTSGAAYCWGGNGFGALGDNSTVDRLVPTVVNGGLLFASLDASASPGRSCGATTTGVAYCWGANQHGEAGSGNLVDRQIPTLVSGGRSFTMLSTGSQGTCGLTIAGTAFCWGSNSFGQVGDGSFFAGVYNWTTPTAVSGGLVFATITAGDFHTCGLTLAGAAYCWGNNVHGELGDGSNIIRSVPTKVLGGLTFAKISARGSHTCAISTGGLGYCWGDNSFGQLGDGTTTGRLVPTRIADTQIYSNVSVGDGHSCGVTLIGSVTCWGLNTNGQIGDGTTTNKLLPTTVVFP